MEYLQPVIQPTTGIFTNIGSAHDHGFRSRKQKITEKLRLFTKVKKLIYRQDYTELDEEISLILRPVNPFLQTITWSTTKPASNVQVKFEQENNKTRITITGSLGNHSFESEFRDEASLENLTHCILFLLDFGLSSAIIQERILLLRPVAMRLELKEGINHCYIIDDTYNNDVQGLTMALDFLGQQEQRSQKAVIFSDILQTGQAPGDLYASISKLLLEKRSQQADWHRTGNFCIRGAILTFRSNHFSKAQKTFSKNFRSLRLPTPWSSLKVQDHFLSKKLYTVCSKRCTVQYWK